MKKLRFWWLLHELRSETAETRLNAAKKLADSGAVEALARALDAKCSFDVWCFVAKFLAERGDERGIDALIRTQPDNETLNCEILELLKRAGPVAVRKLSETTGNLKDVAVQAYRLKTLFSLDATRAGDIAFRLLEETIEAHLPVPLPRDASRWYAIKEEREKMLIGLLCEFQDVRIIGLLLDRKDTKRCGTFGEWAVPALCKELHRREVWDAAASSLQSIFEKHEVRIEYAKLALESFISVRDSSLNNDLYMAILTILDASPGRFHIDFQADVLIALLKSKDFRASRAITGLGRLASPKSNAALKEIVDDKQWPSYLREQAGRVIARDREGGPLAHWRVKKRGGEYACPKCGNRDARHFGSYDQDEGGTVIYCKKCDQKLKAEDRTPELLVCGYCGLQVGSSLADHQRVCSGRHHTKSSDE